MIRSPAALNRKRVVRLVRGVVMEIAAILRYYILWTSRITLRMVHIVLSFLQLFYR